MKYRLSWSTPSCLTRKEGMRAAALATIVAAMLGGGCVEPPPDLPADSDSRGTEGTRGSSGLTTLDSITATSVGADGTATGVGTGSPGCSNSRECVPIDPCSIGECVEGRCVYTPNTDEPTCTCSDASDCTALPEDNDCRTRTCMNGQCGLEFADPGTPLEATQQVAEDCQQLVCDGEGGTRQMIDATDTPDDGLECTDDLCMDGVPVNAPVDRGVDCGLAGECDGRGTCLGCETPADCGGETTFCSVVTCVAEVCGIELTEAGAAVPEQIAGDCLEVVCDGRGNATPSFDDRDVPADDGNDCTAQACNAGVGEYVDLPANSACSTNGGLVCDGAGSCVECTSAAQCANRNVCMVATCVNNACALTPNQGAPCDDGQFCTAVDTCNGSGNCVGSGNPCPGADGDSDCSEGCNEVANNCSANDPGGSACNDGLFCTASDSCNGSGSCVGSGNPCPGADGDSDCSEGCNEAANNCTSNDPNGSNCGDLCSYCSNGSCQSLCSNGEFCCERDICVSAPQQCP